MQPATQLEDSRPQIDTPLRIKTNANVPSRDGRQSRDEYIKSNAFSPAAFASSGKLVKDVIDPKSAATKAKVGVGASSSSVPPKLDHDAHLKTAINDYTVLAFSSKRAGKLEVEASAYIALAVVYDNQGNLKKGIENYKLYLEIMEEIGDVGGAVPGVELHRR